MGSRNIQQTQHSQRRCQRRLSCQVGNLAQGYMNAFGVPDLSGTFRKGTKECCQWDVQISKIVNLAPDTWETQMCCLLKKTTLKWWRLATRHKPLSLLSLAVLWQPLCTLRMTSLGEGLLCCSCCSSRWSPARSSKCVVLHQRWQIGDWQDLLRFKSLYNWQGRCNWGKTQWEEGMHS